MGIYTNTEKQNKPANTDFTKHTANDSNHTVDSFFEQQRGISIRKRWDFPHCLKAYG